MSEHPKVQIENDIKAAMRAKDSFRRDALRALSAAFKQAEVDQRKDLSPDEALAILEKEVKRRHETISDLEKAGRDTSEIQQELAIIENYLPEKMDRATVEAHARDAIAEVNATTAKDIGNVMRVLMPRLKGQADGKMVNEVVRELLS